MFPLLHLVPKGQATMTVATTLASLEAAAEQMFVSPKGVVTIEGHDFRIPSEEWDGVVPPALTTRDKEGKTHNLSDDEIMKSLLVESYRLQVAANGESDDAPSLGGEFKVGHTSDKQSDENMARFAKYATPE